MVYKIIPTGNNNNSINNNNILLFFDWVVEKSSDRCTTHTYYI